jgi:3-hydroxyisobutyrate dehydrogenase
MAVRGSSSPTVAVLGAGGTMGAGMARNVARAGLDVLAWNRSREKLRPLAEEGVTLCETAADAVAGAEVIVTMLSDADAVLATMRGEEGAKGGGALASAREGAVWAQMATIGEDGTARCAELAREREVAFVDAPVLGTKQPAAEGKLVVLASGAEDERVRSLLRPVFDAVGRRTLWVGEAGAGSRLKLVTNAWIVSVNEGVAEALALAEGLELDPALFLDAIEDGPLDAPYARIKATAMIARDFTPTFALKHATKDAKLAVEAAARRGLELPMLDAIAARMQEAVRQHGDEDLSATYLTSAPGDGEPLR